MTKDTRLIKVTAGLPQTKADALLEQFQDMFTKAAEYENKATGIIVTDAKQKDLMQQARGIRLELKAVRVKTENTRKTLKEQSLIEGKAIDGMSNIIKALIIPLEAHLQQQEDFIKIQEAARIAALVEDRKKLLSPYGMQDTTTNLGSMPEDQFQMLLVGVKAQYQEEQDRIKKEEEDRIAAEQAAEADRLRLQEENKRLAQEAADTKKEVTQLKRQNTTLKKKVEEPAVSLNFYECPKCGHKW